MSTIDDRIPTPAEFLTEWKTKQPLQDEIATLEQKRNRLKSSVFVLSQTEQALRDEVVRLSNLLSQLHILASELATGKQNNN